MRRLLSKSMFTNPVLWCSVLALAMAALVLYPVYLPYVLDATADEPAENTRITDYRADFDVDRHGDAEVTERITVDFPDDRQHGIFRYFDHRDPNAPGTRRVPSMIDVEVDPDLTLEQRLDTIVELDGYYADEIEEARAKGDEAALAEIAELRYPIYEMTHTTTERWGRYTNLRIGTETDRLPAGEHVYVIRYRMNDLLLPHGDASRLHWNLIPGGWNQPIDHAELSVRLPGEASGLRCTVGVAPTDDCGAAAGGGTNDITVTASDLPPRTPVTLRADVSAKPSVVWDELPWPVTWDPVLGQDTSRAAVVLVLAVIALAGGIALSMRSRDRLSPTTTNGSPPPDIGPAQAGMLLTKRATPALITATIFHAAARGAIDVEQLTTDGRARFQLSPVKAAPLTDLDPVTRRLANWVRDAPRQLGRSSSKAATRNGRWLKREIERIRKWAIDEGYLVEVPSWKARWAAVLVATAATVVLALWAPDGTVIALVPGLFALGAAYSVRPSARLRRTPAGRELAERLIGVRELVADPSGDPTARSRFADYLPWAVAFGSVGQWSATNQSLGASDQAPQWLYTVAGTEGAIDSGIFDITGTFEATVSSSISAYQRSVSASGSGGSSGGYSGGGSSGGDFSGGGGGGGDGGGGSW